MKTYAVIARFDADTTELLSNYKNQMKQRLTFDATGDWPPHLTLGCYEMDDFNEICGWSQAFASKWSKIVFKFSSLGVFCRGGEHQDTEVIYIVPTFSKSLTSFYYGYHEKFDEYSGSLGFPYTMQYGHPAIHSSITICKTTEFHLAMDYLRVNFVPFDATIQAIEVYELPMKLIARYELR